jgi:hypothetical protein
VISGGTVATRSFKLADVNGDGKADAVVYVPGSSLISVALSGGAQGSPFSTAVNYTVPAGNSNSLFEEAELNGDHRSDFLVY